MYVVGEDGQQEGAEHQPFRCTYTSSAASKLSLEASMVGGGRALRAAAAFDEGPQDNKEIWSTACSR